MMINIRIAHGILAAALSLYPCIPAAAVEDAMRLDTTFRESLQRRDAPEQQEERRFRWFGEQRDVQGRRPEVEKRNVRDTSKKGDDLKGASP